MKKVKLRKSEIFALVGMCSLALVGCGANVLAVNADDSSSSAPTAAEYPLDLYPSADFSGLTNSDGFNWRYKMDINHNYLGGESSPWINTASPAIYVLRHISITYDGYGEYDGATWQMLEYVGSNIVSASDINYSFLRDSSMCWFALYSASAGMVNYDFFNFAPLPLFQNVGSRYGYTRVGDYCMRYQMARQTNTQIGFYLTDDNADDPSDMVCTKFLNRFVWNYAQTVVRGGMGTDIAYNYGYTAGQADGKREGYDNGYSAGYDAGRSSMTDNGRVMTDLFGAVASVPINILNGLAPLAIWNVPIISICLSFIFLGLVLYIVRKFI